LLQFLPIVAVDNTEGLPSQAVAPGRL